MHALKYSKDRAFDPNFTKLPFSPSSWNYFPPCLPALTVSSRTHSSLRCGALKKRYWIGVKKKVLVFIENEELPRKFYRCNCVYCIILSWWIKIGMTVSRVSCPLVQLVMSNAAKWMSVNPTYHTTLQKPSWHSSLREKPQKHKGLICMYLKLLYYLWGKDLNKVH